MPKKEDAAVKAGRFQMIGTIAAALITVAGAILVGYWQFGSRQGAVANYVSASNPRLSPEAIEFTDDALSGTLHPDLQWEAGRSERSGYALEGEELLLTAGPKTWPSFPIVYNPQPLTGDFSAQVKLVFAPSAAVLTNSAQMAGILVRPASARLVEGDFSFPQDWGVTGKTVTDAGTLVGCRGPSWTPYWEETVFLMIERKDGAWRCAHSPNGENWTWFNTHVDNAAHDGPLVVSLFAYSDTEEAMTVRFSDWIIFRDKDGSQ